MLCFDFIDVSVANAIDTITSTQFIKDPETLCSKSGNFTLGFFSPENSTNRYVGIWWQPQFTVVSVLNRDQPLKDSSGVVKISDDGNDLVVLNGKKEVIWTSDVPNIATNSSSILLDSGNLDHVPNNREFVCSLILYITSNASTTSIFTLKCKAKQYN
ncbi:unnamed protein product [Trifolium pratense]|uniref:Uncharacterized protein n=1 Tax=Trifolium pratense TaxID=57577 RepID=A0ACB0LGD8_TRIPR|nr:unnamed protein product [Trifolium pratense]